MIERIKNSKFTKVISVFLAINMLADIILPNAAFALTGGPSQPEVQSFTPVGTSDMVDLFTGDFNYNIPLLDVGGYPINISYSSGIGMDQEASWVGLGWNINPGAITRNMRGLPDDFSGDLIEKEFNMKENKTYGVTLGVGAEVAGYQGLSLNASLGIRFNNYSGYSTERSVGLSYTNGSKSPLTSGLTLTSSSDDGLGVSPNVSFSTTIEERKRDNVKGSLSFGASFNSRAGLQYLSMGVGVSHNASDLKRTKNKNEAGTLESYNGNASKTFGINTYIPSIDMPMNNCTYTLNGKVGGTFCGIDGSVSLSGYYSKQVLTKKEDKIPAYGYMYSQNTEKSTNVLLDYNREKDGSFSRNTPALPLTNFSYDIFSVAGQGVGGTYRPFRGDMGVIFDRSVNNTSASYTLGADVNIGNVAQAGVDVAITNVNTTCGKWTSTDYLSSQLAFKKAQVGSDFEPYYFKQIGEKSVDEDNMYSTIGTDNPVMFNLKDLGGYEVGVSNSYKNISGSINLSNNARTKRQKRNQDISIITKKDYNKYALDAQKNTYYPHFSTTAKESHIAEMSIIRPDGSRYVYGLPAYNKKQVEVSFSVTGDNNSTGEIEYFHPQTGSNFDDSKDNKKGIDNYYSSTKLPPYAHSYMLTAVLSADYIDLTGDGPSDDDLGSYTKFEYETIKNYNWRTPYGNKKASYNQGLKTVESDDKGNYIYGEKDLYYLTKIISNNYVAVFTLEDRHDGHGVINQQGGIDISQVNRLLRKISLYSKSELSSNGELNIKTITNSIPIKEVHFEYNYSLCSAGLGVPNNDGLDEANNEKGKLTLTGLYFTYQKSNKGKFSKYEFEYNTDRNYAYGVKNYDRWGNYKPSGSLPNSEFPYVEQDKRLADEYSTAWTMTGIKLPSGGKIEIDYESDDYAYIQNKKAMQMFKLSGISNGAPPTSTSNPTINQGLAKDNTGIFLYFEAPNFDIKYLDRYFDFTSEMYFRISAKVNRSTYNDGYEYVSGYADISHEKNAGYGNILYNGKQYIWVKILSTTDTDLSNPLAQAAVQFGRLNTPKLIYANSPTDESEDNNGDILNFLKKMSQSSFSKTLLEAAMGGANNYLYNNGIGNSIQIDKSWIRLNSPRGYKYGGGLRVKKVKLTDNWSSMNSTGNAENQTTGQEYEYKTEEGDFTISSGVAQYEPMVGADENPFRTPVSAGGKKAFLAPDDRFYQENPYGESFFPAPTIGYSKVTVKNITESGVTKHATGKIVHEFFTAKDYPVFTDRTDLNVIERKSDFLDKILKIDVKDYMTASQGFIIELNDMHGKQKAQWVYPEIGKTPISGIEYFYKDNGRIVDNKFRRGDKLINSAQVIKSNGTVSMENIGLEFDFITDMREHQTQSENIGDQVNLYGFFAGPIPIVIPPIWPMSHKETTRFRSVSTTKVINRYGILDKTIAYDLGSQVSVENLAYDSETGEVLLTHTSNEYNDDVYSFTYPAHWAYDGMGMSYKNNGYSCNATIKSGSNNKMIVYPDGNLTPFVAGDEIKVENTGASRWYKFWIKSYNKNKNEIEIVDINGVPSTITAGDYRVTVLRSGRRNMQSTPIGSFVSKRNPLDLLVGGIFGVFSASLEVINTNAIEFSDQWKRISNCAYVPAANPCDMDMGRNDYNNGRFGIWRQLRSYLYLDNRTTSTNDTRKDGTYNTFNPFWSYSASDGRWILNSTNWTWASEVTSYSPFGFEIENRDPLNRYSSAIYRYNNKLPVAISANAKQREIFYDGFEDYIDASCERIHPFYSYRSDIINTIESHSGKKSLEIKAGTPKTKTIKTANASN